MNYPLLLAGVIVIVAVVYDLIQTALRLGQRGGPVTVRLASFLWKLALRSPRLLSLAGVVILLCIVLAWSIFNWFGWTLIFAASDNSVVTSTTHAPADLVGKSYFAGYTIFTLGNGDYQPVAGWRVVTVVASASGLMMVTLEVTYLVPLLSAVVEKRTLAQRMSLIGGDIETIVRGLTGPGAGELRAELGSLPQDLLLLRERHLAYPVLHYFQSRERDAAIALNLATLSEALSLIHHGAAKIDPSLAVTTERFQVATDRLLRTLKPWFVTQPPAAPHPPQLDAIARTDLVPRAPEDFAQRVDKRKDARRRLHWSLQDTGWSWADVARAPHER